MISIHRAAIPDLDVCAALFDAYRRFYEQRGDLDAARRFLRDRMEGGESAVFLARDGDRPVGLSQLFPSFSSVRLRRVWILNDLFVTPEARGRGVGRALLEHAFAFARDEEGAVLMLETARDNDTARRLYVAAGMQEERDIVHYGLAL